LSYHSHSYRQKKRQELGSQSDELLALFDYARSLKTMLDRVEHGLYPLRQDESRYSIQIPRSDKPAHELLSDTKALKCTLRLLERRQKDVLGLQKVQREATTALATTARLNEAQAARDMDEVLRAYEAPMSTLRATSRAQLQRAAPTSLSSTPPEPMQAVPLGAPMTTLRTRPQSAHPVLHAAGTGKLPQGSPSAGLR
jgi:hypothetical protein